MGKKWKKLWLYERRAAVNKTTETAPEPEPAVTPAAPAVSVEEEEAAPAPAPTTTRAPKANRTRRPKKLTK